MFGTLFVCLFVVFALTFLHMAFSNVVCIVVGTLLAQSEKKNTHGLVIAHYEAKSCYWRTQEKDVQCQYGFINLIF